MRKIKILLLSCIFALASGLGLLIFQNARMDKSSFGDDIVSPKEVVDADNLVEVLSDTSIYDNPDVVITLDFSEWNEDYISLGSVDMSSVWAAQNGRVFAGTFDGNGYEIRDLKISSQNQYFGLFGRASGTIKNLKLTDFSFDFKGNESQEIYAGAIVGYGIGVTIENCEVGGLSPEGTSESLSQISNNESGSFDIDRKFTYGNIAGEVTQNSFILNAITYTQNEFVCSIGTENVVYIGGVVGRLNNSTIFNNVSNSSLSFKLADGVKNSDLDLYIGGIAGYSLGSSSEIHNTTFVSEITIGSNSAFNFVKGAVAGVLSSENTIGTHISFCYWTDESLNAFGQAQNFQALDSDHIRKVNSLDGAFYRDDKNWDVFNDLYWWNFDEVWIFKLGKIHLQIFERFTVGLANNLDTLGLLDKEKCEISIEDENGESLETSKDMVNGEKKYKHGAIFTLAISFKEENKGFYQIDDDGILLDFKVLPKKYIVGDILETKSTDGKLDGYKMKVRVCSATSGNYSFKFNPIYFEGEVEVQDRNPIYGGVKISTGQTDTDKLSYSNFAKGAPSPTFEAVPKSPYDFVAWQLYYVDQTSESGWRQVENFSYSQKTIKFVFGGDNSNYLNQYFNQKFKLVATFSDSSAVLFTFSGYDPEIITSIKFNNEEYIDSNHPIKIASYETRIPLQFNVKAGYVFDEETFEIYMNRYYGKKKNDALFSHTIKIEEDGSNTYTYPYINVKTIKENIGTSTKFNFQLTSIVQEKEENTNLTWLWITLGVVGFLLIVGGVVAFILIRRRNTMRRLVGDSSSNNNQKNKVKKTKAKKVDYKDYYN